MKPLPKNVRDHLVTLGMDATASDAEARSFASEKGIRIVESNPESEPMTHEQYRDLLLTSGKYGCVQEISEQIRAGKTYAECLDWILQNKANATPVRTAEIGLTKKEARQFSFCKAILALRDGNWKNAEFEREVSEATAKQLRMSPRGFCIPLDVMQSDPTEGVRLDGQVVGTATSGGNLVATELLSGSFIDLLKKHLVLSQMGMTVLSGLVGNIAIPRATGGLTYYFVGEQAKATLSTATFDQISMTPKTAAGKTIISRLLLLQSSISIEQYIRTLLAEALAEALEYGCLVGSGTSSQPLGLLKMTGLNSVAIGENGGFLTGDHIVDMETEVSDDNVFDDGTMAYLTTARVRGKLKRTQEFEGTNGRPLWMSSVNSRGVGDLNGYPAYVGSIVPKDGTKGTGSNLSSMIFGRWSDALLALWGGIDVIADPYSGSDNGDTKIVAFESFDFGIKHKESFCLCTDIQTSGTAAAASGSD